jgi:hypothetical protein
MRTLVDRFIMMVMLRNSERGLSSVYVVRETSPKISLNEGNGKLNTQNKEWIGICIITRINLPAYFSRYHAKKIH